MTPLQIASAHCANYRDGGRCQKIIIQDDGSLVRRPSMPDRCNIGTPGTRCQYFEECVMPMGPKIDNPYKKQEFLSAIHDYQHTSGYLPAAKERFCPACGKPLERRKRFCPTCAQERHRNQTRAAMAKSRVRCEQLSEKHENCEPDSQGLAECKKHDFTQPDRG